MDDLNRFIEAQDGTYETALEELRQGRKRTHWMWFILPQLTGLGHSEMSRYYGIADLHEAQAYAAHPVLGTRLRDCIRATLRHTDKTPLELLGSPDDQKYRSCLTLFATAAPEEPLFAQALATFYAGEQDPRTLRLLGPRKGD